jgi:hypothetical protein
LDLQYASFDYFGFDYRRCRFAKQLQLVDLKAKIGSNCCQRDGLLLIFTDDGAFMLVIGADR